MNNSYAAIRVLLVGAALGGLAQADVIFDRGLPNATNVNGTNPATRSNEAWVTGFFSNPADPMNSTYNIVGDNFSFNFTGQVNSITVFEVANNTDFALSAPTQEFSSISLYEGSATDAGAGGIPLVSSTYSFAQVPYPGGPPNNFVDLNGTAFPIYALTFSGLNLPVTAGTLYDFALDAVAKPGGCATSPFGDPCFLALHASNAALAGTPQQGADVQFINFLLAGTATQAGTCNAACQASTASVPSMAGTDIDVRIVATPEPATWSSLATVLGGLMLFARKRARAR